MAMRVAASGVDTTFPPRDIRAADEKRRLAAVAFSNAVGLVVDSVVFLWLAFGSLSFLSGQVLAKAWTTLAAIAVIAAVRATSRSRPELA